MLPLFPECQPYAHHHLQVSDTHQLYVEQCGNPQGIPVVFLHGGPGSGCNAGQRRFFDPAVYRIVLFDQRGCGRSLPAGETRDNTTQHLVDDIEHIRRDLKITRWHVFGGSWGSTLALAYAVQYAEIIISLTLRGIFLSRPFELAWFLGQVQLFYPEAWQTLVADVPTSQHPQVLDVYASRIFSQDPTVNIPAAIRWNAFESSIMSLVPKVDTSDINGAMELARARVQIHYIQHGCFVDGEQLLKQAQHLKHIPTSIVQGRYDMVCPPQTAWSLAQAMPHAKFFMVPDAGHSAMEVGTRAQLIAATERYKHLQS